MSTSNFPSIKRAIKQMLDVVYKHVQELSRMLSIFSISESEDLVLQTPVEEGWVEIKFIDRPKTKYFIYPSLLETAVEIADSTIPIPPYIDLYVKDRLFRYAAVPSIVVKGVQHELFPPPHYCTCTRKNHNARNWIHYRSIGSATKGFRGKPP